MKLKPCPFCGGEDITVLTKFQREMGGVTKETESYCGCASCGVGAIEETKGDAIKAWDRRSI